MANQVPIHVSVTFCDIRVERKILVLLVLITTYSLFFALPDAWLGPYRIHPSAEVAQHNRASRSAVLLAVFFQQAVQTLLGWFYVGGEDRI